MRLFAAFDAGGPAAPALSPPVIAAQSKKAVDLRWTTPDDGGSPLLKYRIYRGASDGSEQMIGEVKSNIYAFSDRLKNRGGANFYYRVTAVNAYGESPRSVKAFVQTGE